MNFRHYKSLHLPKCKNVTSLVLALAMIFTNTPIYARAQGPPSEEVTKESTDTILASELNNTIKTSSEISKRLIVKATKLNNTYGAKETTAGSDFYILTYENNESAEAAYNKFKDMGLKVDYDLSLVSVDANDKTTNDSSEVKKDVETVDTLTNENVVNGNEVIVALIDTGVNPKDKLLDGKLVSYNSDFKNFVPYDEKDYENYMDFNGHGTLMAEDIVKTGNENTKIYPIKIFGSQGISNVSLLNTAILNAIEKKVDVICIPSTMKGSSSILKDSIKKAKKNGIPVITAAGNYSSDTKDYCPANINDAITISATIVDKSRASYSNFGANVDFSTYGDYDDTEHNVRYSGTSNATSFATGLVTNVIKSINNLGIDKKNNVYYVNDILKNAASDLGDSGKDVYFGNGFIDNDNINAILSDENRVKDIIKNAKTEDSEDEPSVPFPTIPDLLRPQVAYTVGPNGIEHHTESHAATGSTRFQVHSKDFSINGVFTATLPDVAYRDYVSNGIRYNDYRYYYSDIAANCPGGINAVNNYIHGNGLSSCTIYINAHQVEFIYNGSHYADANSKDEANYYAARLGFKGRFGGGSAKDYNEWYDQAVSLPNGYVTINAEHCISKSGEGWYFPGTTQSVSAIPAFGYSYTQGNNQNVHIIPGSNPVNFKAKAWEFNINYDSNGGTRIANQSGSYEKPCQISNQIPTREGYTFKGWAINKGNRNVTRNDKFADPGKVLAGNGGFNEASWKALGLPTNGTKGSINLIAIWEVNTYELRYHNNNNRPDDYISQTIQYENIGDKCGMNTLGQTTNAPTKGAYTKDQANKIKNIFIEPEDSNNHYIFTGWDLNKNQNKPRNNGYGININRNLNVSGSDLTDAANNIKRKPDSAIVLKNIIKSNRSEYKNGAVINVYAIWDKSPVFTSSKNLYITTDKTKTLTKKDLFKAIVKGNNNYAEINDNEDGYYNIFKLRDDLDGTALKTTCLDSVNNAPVDNDVVYILDYNVNEFKNIDERGSVSVTYRATDWAGNITDKTVDVWVNSSDPIKTRETDNDGNRAKDKTTGKDQFTANYVRFIDKNNYDKNDPSKAPNAKKDDKATWKPISKGHAKGGLEDYSVWYWNDNYRKVLESFLNDEKALYSNKDKLFSKETKSEDLKHCMYAFTLGKNDILNGQEWIDKNAMTNFENGKYRLNEDGTWKRENFDREDSLKNFYNDILVKSRAYAKDSNDNIKYKDKSEDGLDNLIKDTSKYAVYFNANGGDGVMSEKWYEYGKKAQLPANKYTRENHKFLGWSTTPNGKVEYKNKVKANISPDDETIKSVELYAVWKDLNAPYTIIYDPSNASGHMDNSIAHNGVSFALKKCEYTKDGYHFMGWSDVPNGKPIYSDMAVVENLADNDSESNEITLYAIWGRNNPYTLTYDLDGGKGTVTDTVIGPDGYTTLADTPEKKGYTFNGWQSSHSNKIYLANDKFYEQQNGGKLTMKAVWVANKYNLAYDSNFGTDATQKIINDINYPDNITVSANMFNRPGYIFLGWDTKADSYKDDNANYKPLYKGGEVVKSLCDTDNDTFTLYAQWKPITYTINLTGLSKTLSAKIKYDEVKPLIAHTFGVTDTEFSQLTIKPGFNLVGWKNNATGEIFTKEINKSLTITDGATITFSPVYEEATYIVNEDDNNFVYDNDGNLSQDRIVKDIDTFKYSEEKEYNVLPDRPGYEFEGWSLNVGNYTFDKSFWEGKTLDEINTQLASAGIRANSLTSHNGIMSFTVLKTCHDDVFMTAVWKPIAYKITYNLNGGKAAQGVNLPDAHNKEQKLTIPSVSKAGYTFTGWTGTGFDKPTINPVINRNVLGDIHLTANFKANTYTITFNANGGSCNTTTKTFSYGSNLSLPSASKASSGIWNGTQYWDTEVWHGYGGHDLGYWDRLCTPQYRTDYTFDGWYTAASGGTKITNTNKYTWTSNITLYAHWKSSNAHTGTATSRGGYHPYQISSDAVRANAGVGELHGSNTGDNFGRGWSIGSYRGRAWVYCPQAGGYNRNSELIGSWTIFP